MKSYAFGTALFPLHAADTVPGAAQSATSQVTVRVDGFRNEKGELGVNVFRSTNGWPEESAKAVFHANFPISGDHATAQFNLPPGRYAIAVLHDENSNHKLDRNFLGIPTKGFGFSNNPKVLFSAPSFDTAALQVSSPATEMSIHLIYM